MFKYCPIYLKNTLPTIEEGDIFKLTMKYNRGNEGVNGKELILKIIKKSEGLNVSELASLINKSNKTVERYIRDLKADGLIKFKGAPKTGGYYLNTDS